MREPGRGVPPLLPEQHKASSILQELPCPCRAGVRAERASNREHEPDGRQGPEYKYELPTCLPVSLHPAFPLPVVLPSTGAGLDPEWPLYLHSSPFSMQPQFTPPPEPQPPDSLADQPAPLPDHCSATGLLMSFPPSAPTSHPASLRMLTCARGTGAVGTRGHLGPICREKRDGVKGLQEGGKEEGGNMSKPGRPLPLQPRPPHTLQLEPSKTWHLQQKLTKKRRLHPIPFLKFPCG